MIGRRAAGRHRRLALAALATCALSGVAQAGNDEGILVGSEAALTGGAVTATISTGAAMWYNPAGMVNTNDRLVDIGGTGFQFRAYGSPAAIQTTSGEQAEQRVNDTAFVPNAVAVSVPLGSGKEGKLKHRFGFGIFTTRYEESVVRANLTEATETGVLDVTYTNQTQLGLYHVPLTYAVQLAPNFNFGANIHLVVSSLRLSGRATLFETIGSSNNASTLEEQSTLVNQLSFGVRAGVGMQWTPMERLSIGLSVLTPSRMFLTSDQGEEFSTSPGDSGQEVSSEHVDRLYGHFSQFDTMKIRLGGAYLLGEDGYVAAELDYGAPRNNDFVRRVQDHLINGRVGLMYRWRPEWLLGVGVFSDRQAYSGGLEFGEYRVDYYGGSFGFRYNNQGLERGKELEWGITFAPRYAFGVGEVGAVVVDTVSPPTVLGVVPVSTNVHELGLYVGMDLSW